MLHTDFDISTHTPHTGCDRKKKAFTEMEVEISTHTPHTGCDVGHILGRPVKLEFQLTHPTRGATVIITFMMLLPIFQLTHPTRGATLHFC